MGKSILIINSIKSFAVTLLSLLSGTEKDAILPVSIHRFAVGAETPHIAATLPVDRIPHSMLRINVRLGILAALRAEEVYAVKTELRFHEKMVRL